MPFPNLVNGNFEVNLNGWSVSDANTSITATRDTACHDADSTTSNATCITPNQS